MNPTWFVKPTPDVILYFHTMGDAIVCAREMAFDPMGILWDCSVWLLGGEEDEMILDNNDVYVE